MAWNQFPHSPHRGYLKSLKILSVKVLFTPVNRIIEGCKSLPEDPNSSGVVTRWKPPSKCFLEVLYEYNTQPPLLDIELRQTILDYIIRAHVSVRAELFLHLLKDGDVYDLDLGEIEDRIDHDVANRQKILQQIFVQMCASSEVLRKLTIYSSFISSQTIWNKYLENARFPNLKEVQTYNSPRKEFPLEACPNLIKLTLEGDLKNSNQIFECPSSESLIELDLKSKATAIDLMHCLAKFPNITTLHLENIVKLIKHLNRVQNQCCAQSALEVLANLRQLHLYNPMPSQHIKLVIKTCPNLEELSLMLDDGAELEKLAGATKLQRLEICIEDKEIEDLFDSFSDVLPLLEKIGNQLTALSFDEVREINLPECARLCPNLESLKISYFYELGPPDLLLAHPFSKLKSLRLIPHWLDPLCARYLLMGAHQLENVDITFDGITDNDLIMINNENPLKMLKTIFFRSTKSLSPAVMARLVNASISNGNLVEHNLTLC